MGVGDVDPKKKEADGVLVFDFFVFWLVIDWWRWKRELGVFSYYQVCVYVLVDMKIGVRVCVKSKCEMW